ncbi:hypothetical protein Vadar_003953 [Vaccinium darrowii]|uniref:Uncharacterized protein n=1 Tax=Vaccinium darrowii TaxID=229202 RepID=A0ACB7Z9I1_9ERIC|nr:hypothetical protein Vadar_003953 [Vaccinium darrowii]
MYYRTEGREVQSDRGVKGRRHDESPKGQTKRRRDRMPDRRHERRPQSPQRSRGSIPDNMKYVKNVAKENFTAKTERTKEDEILDRLSSSPFSDEILAATALRTSHSKLDEAITEREKAEQKYYRNGKSGNGRKDVNSIQEAKPGRSNDPRRNSYRGPRPQEFEGIVTVFKYPLHELHKKIKREARYRKAPKNAPQPPFKDTKQRCRYHDAAGNMTTWCPQFKAYLEEKVAEGKLEEHIEHEKTIAKAKGSNGTDDKDEELIDVAVIHGYADVDAEQRLRQELKSCKSSQRDFAEFAEGDPSGWTFPTALMKEVHGTRLRQVCLRRP